MIENVFILGAGASFDAGAPLMSNFLDSADDLRRYSRSKIDGTSFDEVFDVLNDLQRVHAKSFLHLNNIEALFGAIEMGQIINQLGKRTNEQITFARQALVQLIVQTLENNIRFPIRRQANNPSIHSLDPTITYKEFVELLRPIRETTSVITFNYDVALDYAMYKGNIEISYELEDNASTSPNVMRLLKLHGSLNWAKCPDCRRIYPYSLERYFTDRGRQIQESIHKALADNTQQIPIYTSNVLNPQVTCRNHADGEHTVDRLPVIVPPTWNKTGYHGSITRVWQQAALDLSTARNIYVIGYSLPESDSFFRYLFALGTMGESRLQRFWVFNLDHSNETQIRYEKLLGPGIHERFRYYVGDFRRVIQEAKSASITEIQNIHSRNYGDRV